MNIRTFHLGFGGGAASSPKGEGGGGPSWPNSPTQDDKCGYFISTFHFYMHDLVLHFLCKTSEVPGKRADQRSPERLSKYSPKLSVLSVVIPSSQRFLPLTPPPFTSISTPMKVLR